MQINDIIEYDDVKLKVKKWGIGKCDICYFSQDCKSSNLDTIRSIPDCVGEPATEAGFYFVEGK